VRQAWLIWLPFAFEQLLIYRVGWHGIVVLNILANIARKVPWTKKKEELLFVFCEATVKPYKNNISLRK